MKRGKWTASTRRALQYPCPRATCEAPKGVRCMTPSGGTLASVVHAERRALVPIDPPEGGGDA